MALNYDQLMTMAPIRAQQNYTARDTILYALGIGAGIRAINDDAWLRYVYEDGLVALPTMAVVLAPPGFWLQNAEYGLDWRKILHAEQSVIWHKPVAVEGRVRSETSVGSIVDKGADKGAILTTIRKIFDAAADELIAEVNHTFFLRGDGGFAGGSTGGNPAPAPTPRAVPTREPDAVDQVETRPEQALIYRLSGDYNPLHASPQIASQAGFPKPIMHGLASFGAVGAIATAALCGGDPAKLKRLDARFSSPVFPGETLRVELWKEQAGIAMFQVSVVEREVVVLKNGYAEYGN